MNRFMGLHLSRFVTRDRGTTALICSALAIVVMCSFGLAQIKTKVKGKLGKLNQIPPSGIMNNKITQGTRDVTSILERKASEIDLIDTYSSNSDVEVRAVKTQDDQPMQIIITGLRKGTAVVEWKYMTAGGGDGGLKDLQVEITD